MALTALLEKNATAKKPAAKKSSAPSLDAPAEVKAAVDAFNKAKVAEKNAKAEMALHGEKIMSHVRPLADADGFKGSFKNSNTRTFNSDPALHAGLQMSHLW